MVARAGVPEASSVATRHVMQANRSKNTTPELTLRAELRAAGLTGYRLHWKKAPGRPDVCFPGRRVAIFVHGCFWHAHSCTAARPRTHAKFWAEKFARNRARDERNVRELLAAGWTVVVVWECELKRARRAATVARVVAEVRRAGEGRLPAHVVDAGAVPAWRLRRRRARSRRRS